MNRTESAESPWVVVTGGGTGIGQALVHEFAGAGHPVLAVGRRREPLEATRGNVQAAYPDAHVAVVSADVGSPEGRSAIEKALGDQGVHWLIHNAGVLDPVGPVTEVTLEAWRAHHAINVEGPLFLTQQLLPRLTPGARILHVSSGAAHRSIPGWGAYCTSKAALHQLYRVLRDDLAQAGYDVAVGSLRPSVVDTPMQSLIREQTPDRFPAVEQFRAMKSAGQLHDPVQVARFTHWMLAHTDSETFSAEEWDFGDAKHRAQWEGAR